MSEIRNPALAPSGWKKIEWVRAHMPLLATIEERFIAEKPFAGKKVSMSIHLEAKTARLALLMKAGGAQVAITGCNPLSTQDDIAAALAQEVDVFAYHAATPEEYDRHLRMALAHKPDVFVDDGGDFIGILLGEEGKELVENVIGGCEETTTGIMRLRAREKDGMLPFPMFNINDADCKHLFDNRYGTGQSVWDGITRTTNLTIAGRTVVVAGYGWCGKGVSMRARGLGANVVVTEIDPVKAIEAVMDGFRVLPMIEAAKIGDLFITVTGCRDIVTKEHFAVMRDGAILCNAGHFDVEVSKTDMEALAVEEFDARNNIRGYKMADGRTFYLLAEGRLVNLASGDGHPAEIMDMSFALQALCCEHMAKNGGELRAGLHSVPVAIDQLVARLRLETMGVSLDVLTEEQKSYLEGWEVEA